MRKTGLLAFSVLLIGFRCFSQTTTVATGSIRGDVFTKSEGGELSVVPATHVALHGPVEKETQADQHGAYSFDSVPPGEYLLEASAPGLSTTLKVEVSPGATATAPLELNIVTTNSFKDDPEIFLTEADRKWLKAIDCAFSRKVHHA
jgi:hypothetical protein